MYDIYTWLFTLNRRDRRFFRRSSIVLPASHKPIDQGDDEQETEHRPSPIHRSRRGRCSCRERQPDANEDPESDSVKIYGQTKFAERERPKLDRLAADAFEGKQRDRN